MKPWHLAVAGVTLIALGTVGMHVALTRNNLSSMVVSLPAPAMIPTGVGAGGQEPTQVLPGANTPTGIQGSGDVPTAPTLFLKPETFTSYGIPTATEPAYWKVWWNGTTQTKAVVSLQQHDTSGSASQALDRLVARNSKTANFTNADFQISRTSSFTVAGVPGATGLVWDATEGQGSESLPIEFRFAVFHRRSVVALVSMTSYSRATDAAAFLTFAQSQYAQMSAAPALNLRLLIFNLIRIAGVALVIIALIVKLARRRKRPAPPVSIPDQVPRSEPIQDTFWRPPQSVPFSISYPVDLEAGTAVAVHRWRPLANWLLAIPLVIWGLVLHYGSQVVAVLGWFCILVTGRLPERWGEYLVGVLRYYWRVWSFALGFTSVYPGLRVPAGYVDPGDFPCILYSAQPLRRNRLTVAFRAVLVLPRLLLLMVIYPVLLVLLLFAWCAVLVTGRWPHDLRWLIIQWLRWSLQVAAFGLLVVDDHPRFEMQALS